MRCTIDHPCDDDSIYRERQTETRTAPLESRLQLRQRLPCRGTAQCDAMRCALPPQKPRRGEKIEERNRVPPADSRSPRPRHTFNSTKTSRLLTMTYDTIPPRVSLARRRSLARLRAPRILFRLHPPMKSPSGFATLLRSVDGRARRWYVRHFF